MGPNSLWCREEKIKEVQKIQDSQVQLIKELQDTKVRLSREFQDTQHKLDRFYPEIQSLQDELQNAEMQNSLLEIALSKKNDEPQILESLLDAFTSLVLASSPVKEPIA